MAQVHVAEIPAHEIVALSQRDRDPEQKGQGHHVPPHDKRQEAEGQAYEAAEEEQEDG